MFSEGECICGTEDNEVYDIYVGGKALENGEYIVKKYAQNIENDAFGHVQLGGCSSILANIVSQKLNISTRSIELNLPQRCASHISSLTDINEAYNCGKHAIELAINGNSNYMVTMIRNNTENYKITYGKTLLSEVANSIKYFPTNWIINGCDISNEFIEYSLPLIRGNMKTKIKQLFLEKTIVFDVF